MATRAPDAMRGPTSMRRANEWAVLTRLHDQAPVSVPQLAADTGLSRPTVNLALANLQDGGLVRQTGVRSGQAGRAARLWEPEARAGWIVSVDVGVRWTKLVLADLGGEVVARGRERSEVSDSTRLVRQISRLVDGLLAEHGTPLTDVLSIVVGSPGVFDPATRRVRLASNLPGWDRPAMVALLAEELGDRVVFENDIDLAALGEQAAGLGRDVRDFVYLSVGSGIGMGTVIDGRLHRGAHGAAGEIAFLLVDGATGAESSGAEPPGAEAEQDGEARWTRGELESAAAADAIVAAARSAGLAGAESAGDVFAAARAGDPRARAAVARETDLLARALVSVVATVDPELVVLGGGVGGHAEFLLEPLRERLTELVPLPLPELAVSAVGEEAAVLGGIAHARQIAHSSIFERYCGNAPAPVNGS
ncbi:ROK family transcriptional regulator [Streptomyces sp. HNM0575]|uniref:ROK family transcriptional regulator n=1 Tax=Streptomyces sp. HNM0575 TaxID=2716338 RepID=UPI00145D38BF|nr:ROK family transcriptional regulator [Streptomyces sp. HNM0575]NLU71520.1 ROK family transcriptional regulator [Streptomyces sp. HNM0575]